MSLVVLNCLFRTSAGVSGISSPRRTWTVFLTTVPESKARHDHFQQDQNHDEQNHEAEVHGHHTDPESRYEAAQQFQRRICDREDTLGDHQQYAGRTPVAGENLNPAEDHPADQYHEVDRQYVNEDFLQVLHESTLPQPATASSG